MRSLVFNLCIWKIINVMEVKKVVAPHPHQLDKIIANDETRKYFTSSNP
jgi:hypothetical protein